MRDLNGALVVISGASAGIGLACARCFLAEGSEVLLVARGEARLQSVVASLGERAHAVVADIGTMRADNGVAAVEQIGRPVSVLVNNAGLHHRGLCRQCRRPTAARCESSAPIRLTRLLLNQLQSTQGAVNVASLAGCVPVPNSAVYSSTKFDCVRWALAHELAPDGVTVR